MNEIIKEITIDLTRKSKTRVVFAKQLDNGSRKLKVSLTDNGRNCIAPKTAIATFNVLRADGESNAFPASITSDGKIEVTLGSWTLAVSGEARCTFAIYFDKDKRLSTPEIILEVGEELYTGEDVSIDSDYSLLTSLLSECALAVDAEAKRGANELNRAANESTRTENEEKRISTENVRNQKESERIQRERLRSEAESNRSSAEEQRKSNENERIAAEDERQAVMGELDNTLEGIISLQNQLKNGTALLPTAYPIGSIYMSVNPTDPAYLFGGSWVALKDRFLVGAGGAYGVTTEGGAASHKHGSGTLGATVTMSNSSILISSIQQKDGINHKPTAKINASTRETYTGETDYIVPVIGSTGDANYLPPYYAVYMWRREA